MLLETAHAKTGVHLVAVRALVDPNRRQRLLADEVLFVDDLKRVEIGLGAKVLLPRLLQLLLVAGRLLESLLYDVHVELRGVLAHLGTLVDLNTFEVIYEEDFVNEQALSMAWVDKSPGSNEAKYRLCVPRLQKDASFFNPTPSSVSLRLILALAHQRN